MSSLFRKNILIFIFLILNLGILSLSFSYSYSYAQDEFEEITASDKEKIIAKAGDSIQEHKFSTCPLSYMKENVWKNVWPVLTLGLLGSLAFMFKYYWMRYVFLLISLVWLGFIRGGCSCGVGAGVKIFSDLSSGSIYFIGPLIMLTLIMGITLIWGRIFCSFVCPLGALQEFLNVRSKTIKISYKKERKLRHFQWVVFILLVGISIFKSRYFFEEIDPFKAIFSQSGNVFQWIAAGLLLPLCLFLYRPFCRYLCPLTLYLRLAGKFSWFKIKKINASCTDCSLCKSQCPVSVIDHKNNVDDANCIRCGECLEKCKLKAVCYSKGGKHV